MGQLITRLRSSRTVAELSPATIAVLVLALLVRVALVLAMVPLIHTAWFVPFFDSAVADPSLDPWETFLRHGGDSESFPYGPVMFLWFGLWAWLTSWLPAPWGTQMGLGLGLLALEVLLWVLVTRWRPAASRTALLLIALSPLAIYASYIHGQLDLLPTLLMFASLLLLRDRHWTASGVLAGLAIAAKLSSAIVPPLILIFLLRNARFREHTRAYALGLVPGLLLTVLPILLPGYRTMVLQTPESQSVVAYALELGPGLSLVVLPAVYLALAGLLYRFKRGNPDIVVLAVGVMLTAVTLLTPASPGWYLWSVPFLAVLAAPLGRQAVAAVWLFWAAATATLTCERLARPGGHRWQTCRSGHSTTSATS